jgi:8-oxo-dGTP pyrophosphatase MutT (NUDIX family)
MELEDRLRHERTQIVVEGRLQPKDIKCSYSPIGISFTQDESSIINTEWKNVVTKKQSVFDGKLFHVKQQKIRPRHLIFDTCMSNFREWIGTKSNRFKRIFGQGKTIRPLSVGSMVITADNKWIIGRRFKTHDFQGQYTLLAGYMDPDRDVIDSKPNPFFAVRSEIEEETGLDMNKGIRNSICLGLDGVDQPYLAFSTQLNVPYAELIAKVPKENEFRNFEVYQYDKLSIEKFIKSNYKHLTPHSLANMLMVIRSHGSMTL